MVDIRSISIQDAAEGVRVSAQIVMPGREGEAWYQLPPQSATDSAAAADAFFVIGLILAMGTDGELVMTAPVSKKLLHSSKAAQDILLGWYPRQLKRAVLHVAARETEATEESSRTITCFTGGVDSFYSLVANRDEVDALLYVHGFDIPLSRTTIREVTSAHLRDVAASTDTELVEVSTNVRQFLNLAGKWPTTTHGLALASVAHLMRRRFGRMLLPGSHTYADHYPWGSHPLLDHLWSSRTLDVIHDGGGTTRVDKTLAIAYDDVARQHLRVCWQNTGKYNCGKCGKCVRTMIALSLTGVLQEFSTFESEVSLDDIRALGISGRSDESFVLENIAYAKQQGNAEIAGILEQMVADFRASKKRPTKAVTSTATLAAAPSSQRAHVAHVANAREIESLRARVAQSEADIRRIRSMLPLRTWSRISDLRRR